MHAADHHVKPPAIPCESAAVVVVVDDADTRIAMATHLSKLQKGKSELPWKPRT